MSATPAPIDHDRAVTDAATRDGLTFLGAKLRNVGLTEWEIEGTGGDCVALVETLADGTVWAVTGYGESGAGDPLFRVARLAERVWRDGPTFDGDDEPVSELWGVSVDTTVALLAGGPFALDAVTA